MKSPHSPAVSRFVLRRRPPRLTGSVNVGRAGGGGGSGPLALPPPLLLHRRRGGAVLLREQWRPIKETIMHCIGGPN